MKSSNRLWSIVESKEEVSRGDAAINTPLRLLIMLKPHGFPETRPSLLAQLAENSDQLGWREFFQRYAPAVFRVARHRGLTNEDADDVVQQVMISIARHMKDFRYDRDRGYFRQWVRRIANNFISNCFRGQRPIQYDSTTCERLADEETAESVWDAEWQLQDLLWCMDQIEQDVSPRRMKAFRMYAFEGRSAADVAKDLGMTPGHVYVIRHQMLALLRERLMALYGESDGQATDA
ncbi:MAG: sigma-70 family RNA polymerase sigma factor [Phycisphaerales bacterium]|nr:sigma-70 family RNA polymerase sigma factor [Phycisphaerales bacterium]